MARMFGPEVFVGAKWGDGDYLGLDRYGLKQQNLA